MAKERYQVVMWVINTLMNYKKLSLEELNRLYILNSDISGGTEFTRHQLRRAISTANLVYGIIIGCDSHDNYRYYIESNKYAKSAEWAISSRMVNQMLTDEAHASVRNRILLDGIPSGQYHLSSILDAMSKNVTLQMVYQKFADSEPYSCLVEPYCVKFHEQRWYLLGRKDHRSNLQTFALDRIHRIDILFDKPFTIPQNFDAEKYYAHAYGVFAGPDCLPQEILIRVSPFWRQYLFTLPLHPSQKEIQRNTDSSIFSYQLAVTPDLLNRLLSFGANLEVLAPAELRHQMANAILQMSEKYK